MMQVFVWEKAYQTRQGIIQQPGLQLRGYGKIEGKN